MKYGYIPKRKQHEREERNERRKEDKALSSARRNGNNRRETTSAPNVGGCIGETKLRLQKKRGFGRDRRYPTWASGGRMNSAKEY